MRRHINRSVNTISNWIKLLSVELGIVLIAFISSLAVVAFLIKQVFVNKTFELDDKVFVIFEGYVSDATTRFFNFFTIFGSHYFLVPANLIFMAIAFFVIRDKWFGIKVTSVAFSSLFLMFGLKQLFNRPRPEIPLLGEVPGFNSFPSGHAFMSFAFFGLLIYVINNKVKNLFLKYLLIILNLIIILIIGLSRIYLRVHYTSDVMAGMAIGLIWLVISISVINYIQKRRRSIPFIPNTIDTAAPPPEATPEKSGT